MDTGITVSYTHLDVNKRQAERQPEFNEYHATFIDMIEKIQDYCEARNVPFLFVFEPAKISVLQDELQEGINYNNDWVQDFMKELDRRDINYVDNTSLLKEKMEEGENVFNKKYNAGHWNDLGAFYGVNNVLDALKAWYPTCLLYTSLYSWCGHEY